MGSPLPLPFGYDAHLHRMQSGAAAPGDGAIEDSGFLARPSSSIASLLGDQVSSVQHCHHQQRAVDQESAALSALISQQRGETHLNAAKKRMRAVMGCKESPDKDIKSLKRIRTAQCKASRQRNCDSIAKRVNLKPTIVIVEKPNSHQSPLSKQKSLPDQKSSQSKSNATEASSLTQDHFPPIKQDFIHVRARRGQATDSHSLAERVRREKISQRMKYLQDLVPSCIKVSGKAMMLDEIINYVQSLQRQVEFLSMKLAAVPPNRLKFNFDDLCGNKAMQPNNVTSVSGSSSAAATPCVLVPRADYSSNIGQSSCFQNSVRSDETLPDSGRSCDVRSSMHPQTPLDQDISMSYSGADQFAANLSCDLGVDDPLMSRNAADISSCNLGASSTDVILNQPIHQLCISQSSGQVELQWDEDLQTIVQQMGSFNSQANSLLFPLDNLLTEGFFVQGIAKEEL